MQHYPKNVSAVWIWCNVCNRRTMHRVDDRRVGSCVEQHVFGLSKAQEKRAKKEADKQLELF
jgi:hypothetical protein